ncbi:hypothetical protein EV648_111210 [Kribbella sp. VKM Ac-2568]|nr:hypothetical protein EV648_111210 [Kribbella sp. VKM Ac-2568]
MKVEIPAGLAGHRAACYARDEDYCIITDQECDPATNGLEGLLEKCEVSIELRAVPAKPCHKMIKVSLIKKGEAGRSIHLFLDRVRRMRLLSELLTEQPTPLGQLADARS